jgi:LPXTG-motif cell wall-anchored protein
MFAAVLAPPALSAAQQDPAAAQPAPATAPPAPAPAPGPPAAEPDEAPDANGKPGAEKEDPAPEPAAEAAAPAQPVPTPTAASKQPKAVAAASALVSVGDNFYSPATVSIAVGDSVTWRNNGQAPHSATANNGSFDTGVFNAGQSRSHTFNSAGTFTYFCTVHGSAQSGTVRVAAASGGGGGGDDAGSSATGQSEADAVASAEAAGDANTLPMTGYASGALALVGLMLLAAGVFMRRFDDQRRPFLSFPLR